MYLEIVSPELTLYKGEVESVSVPGVNGEFEMLNDHAPIVSILKEGYVKLFGNVELDEEVAGQFKNKKGERGTWLPIKSGTLEINHNKIMVLVE